MDATDTLASEFNAGGLATCSVERACFKALATVAGKAGDGWFCSILKREDRRIINNYPAKSRGISSDT